MKEKIKKWYKDHEGAIDNLAIIASILGAVVGSFFLGSKISDYRTSLGLSKLHENGYLKFGHLVDGKFIETTIDECVKHVQNELK